MPFRRIAAVFRRRLDARRARRTLTERAGLPIEAVSASGLTVEDAGEVPGRSAIIVAEVGEDRSDEVRAALVGDGGDILLDASLDDRHEGP